MPTPTPPPKKKTSFQEKYVFAGSSYCQILYLENNTQKMVVIEIGSRIFTLRVFFPHCHANRHTHFIYLEDRALQLAHSQMPIAEGVGPGKEL